MDVNSASMSVRSALQAIVNARNERTVVVTNQGSARIWPLLEEHSLDFHYNPSTMGGAIPLALGLAIARVDLHVIVISGDGSLAMNLGSLISVVGTGATNLSVIVLDNGIYEVTGGQKTASQVAHVDFEGIARAAGFPVTKTFSDASLWRQQAADLLLHSSGPHFVSLRVARAEKADLATPSMAMSQQLSRFQAALTRPAN